MAIKNVDSNDFYLYLPIVLTFSIAAYPVGYRQEAKAHCSDKEGDSDQNLISSRHGRLKGAFAHMR